MKEYFRQLIRKAMKNDIYHLLDELDDTRRTMKVLERNIYDLLFASLITLKAHPKKIANCFEEDKLIKFASEFQTALDKFEAAQQAKMSKALVKKVKKGVNKKA